MAEKVRCSECNGEGWVVSGGGGRRFFMLTTFITFPTFTAATLKVVGNLFGGAETWDKFAMIASALALVVGAFITVFEADQWNIKGK